ncbi:hypothetical protein RIF29_17463 [Crotalaria pallida]|uniref:Uncharacterized protein n=1 Tax=Crotalaria pallida TaxID=3830 RepID=A0AAN9IFC1_CROPI
MATSYTIRVEEPCQYSTITQDITLTECFYIKFRYTHKVHSKHSEIPTKTSINETFFIPWNILCDCDDFEVMDPDSVTMANLYKTFSFMDIDRDLLESTFVHMGEHARYMTENNEENRSILEMDVVVHVNSYSSSGKQE